MAGRLYEATLVASYFGQECINRWNYVTDVAATGNLGAIGLGQGLGMISPGDPPDSGSLIEAIMNLANTNVEFAALSVRDVYSFTDFVEIPMGFSGNHATDGLSPAQAYGFKTNRTRLDIRRGFKRLVGVSEGAVATGGVLTGTGISGSQLVAQRMADQIVRIVNSASVTFTPVIVKKEEYVPDPVGAPLKKAYRYFEDETEQLTWLMRDLVWSYYPNVRTQTSRQYNRGR